MRILLKHEKFLGGVLDGPGGIVLQGVIGVHRSEVTRNLIFTAVIDISSYGARDPCIAGKQLRWTEMSTSPDDFGRNIMEQGSMIKDFIKITGHTVQVQDFLSTLAGCLFDTHIRLEERATRNRERNANRAVREMSSLNEVVITTGCNLETKAVEATA